MHRSGINVIGKWLLRQTSLKSKPLKPFIGDWVETLNRQQSLDIGNRFFFVSQINHPDHYIDPEWMYKDDNVVMTIERNTISEIEDFCRDKGLYRYSPIHEYMDVQYSDEPEVWKHVIIIRDFKNWIASVLKAHIDAFFKDPWNPTLQTYRTHNDIAKYKTYLDWATDPTLYFCGREGFHPYIISYDKWFTDKNYRKKIVKDLDLPKFTDAGKNDIPQNCGGSSFDGLTFDGKASEMKVLERWKEYENEEGFIQILEHYKDLVEVSEKFIGE